jgi:anti-sigma F factor antagonist
VVKFFGGEKMSVHIQMAIRKNRLFVRLKGELDQAVTEKLKVRISELIDKYEIKYVIFNFEKLNFMDSSGIGFIIGRYTQVKKRNGKIIVCSMNTLIERIFMLSGLKKICSVAASEDEADKMVEVSNV